MTLGYFVMTANKKINKSELLWGFDRYSFKNFEDSYNSNLWHFYWIKNKKICTVYFLLAHIVKKIESEINKFLLGIGIKPTAI